MLNMLKKKFAQSYINFLKREYIYFQKNKKLKVEFKSSNKIKRNYSQILQDIFVLTILDGKQKGTYVEIGSAHPIRINNTYLLEKYFNWKGLGYDLNENYVDIYKKHRVNKCKLQDALKASFHEDFQENKLPKKIDYLQIDIEPAKHSLECLFLIPFDDYTFNVITFETEFYLEGDKFETLSREYLESKNYKQVFGRVSRLGKAYEDWYVHDSLYEKFSDLFDTSSFKEVDIRTVFFKDYKLTKTHKIFGTIRNFFSFKDIYA